MSHAGIDATVRALNDPGRRAMLDALRLRPGQSLTELGACVPQLGRHAVLKHLRVLETAGLVTTHKSGRHRLTFLNPVPIVELAQRWLDDYAAQAGYALTHLKTHLETPVTLDAASRAMPDPSSTRTIHAAILIAADPARVWTALTDPEECRRWYFGTAIRSTFEPGSSLEYVDADGEVKIRGVVLEVVPQVRLSHTFNAAWSAEVAGDAESTYEWQLEPVPGGLTRVSITHTGVPSGTTTEEEVEAGATFLLSALKTLLETGRTLGQGA